MCHPTAVFLVGKGIGIVRNCGLSNAIYTLRQTCDGDVHTNFKFNRNHATFHCYGFGNSRVICKCRNRLAVLILVGNGIFLIFRNSLQQFDGEAEFDNVSRRVEASQHFHFLFQIQISTFALYCIGKGCLDIFSRNSQTVYRLRRLFVSLLRILCHPVSTGRQILDNKGMHHRTICRSQCLRICFAECNGHSQLAICICHNSCTLLNTINQNLVLVVLKQRSVLRCALNSESEGIAVPRSAVELFVDGFFDGQITHREYIHKFHILCFSSFQRQLRSASFSIILRIIHLVVTIVTLCTVIRFCNRIGSSGQIEEGCSFASFQSKRHGPLRNSRGSDLASNGVAVTSCRTDGTADRKLEILNLRNVTILHHIHGLCNGKKRRVIGVCNGYSLRPTLYRQCKLYIGARSIIVTCRQILFGDRILCSGQAFDGDALSRLQFEIQDLVV